MTSTLSDDDFGELYRRDHHALCGFLRMLGASQQEAEDIAQDTFLELYTRFEMVDRPGAWTRKVARHRLIVLWRRSTLGRRYVSSAVTGVAEPAYEEGEVKRVLELLEELPMRQREVLACAIDGYKPREIAEILGVTPENVRSNLKHARTKIRKLLGEPESGGIS